MEIQLKLTEDGFGEFLKPFLIDILTHDSNVCNQLSLICANFNEEDTEDLHDLEELRKL